MKKFKVFLLGMFLPFIMLMAGCKSVTPEETLEAFDQLPLDNAELITFTIHLSQGSACKSYIVDAIYYFDEGQEDVFIETSEKFLEEGWKQEFPQYLNSENAIQFTSEGKKILTVYDIITQTRLIVIPSGEPTIDLDSLSLPAAHPLDNSLDDGYFHIIFSYFPYPPDNCTG